MGRRCCDQRLPSDFIFQGNEEDILKRLEVYKAEPQLTDSSGPGRPKLGVVSREISLLPRHWEWLATQPERASATLRKLVKEVKKKSSQINEIKPAQERTYKFMSVIAGDFKGYEEALRALYRKDKKHVFNFDRRVARGYQETCIGTFKTSFFIKYSDDIINFDGP